MCGRFVITSSPEALRKLFGYREQPNFPPRYNIAPTQPVPVVLIAEGMRQFRLMRWAFLPSWVKDPKTFSVLINARVETVMEKPAFRNAIRRRRCLVPADGYFEWPSAFERKRPIFICPRSGEPIAFAGVWETWMGPNGEEVDTVALLTTDASTDLSAIHHRMPAVIAPADFNRWLDCTSDDGEVIADLLRPAPAGLFTWYEVSTAVNRVANDNPELIVPLSSTEIEAEEAASRKPVRARTAPKPKAPSSSDQGSLF